MTGKNGQPYRSFAGSPTLTQVAIEKPPAAEAAVAAAAPVVAVAAAAAIVEIVDTLLELSCWARLDPWRPKMTGSWYVKGSKPEVKVKL